MVTELTLDLVCFRVIQDLMCLDCLAGRTPIVSPPKVVC